MKIRTILLKALLVAMALTCAPKDLHGQSSFDSAESNIPLALAAVGAALFLRWMWVPDLFKAAREGELDKVEHCIEQGCDVNKQDKDGITALMLAAEKGHTDVVKRLIEAKADVNMQDNNNLTPLMLAAEKGHTDVVKLLIEKGAEQGSALVYAAQNGHTDTVEFLLKKGDCKTALLRCGEWTYRCRKTSY